MDMPITSFMHGEHRCMRQTTFWPQWP